MNEFIYTPIVVSDGDPIKAGSVFNNDGHIIPVYNSYIELAPFPWLSFLQEDDLLTLGDETFIFGLVDDISKTHISIEAVDALGFYMIDESIRPLYKNYATQADWNKLPSDLSWLYGNRPYMTSSDMTPILLELREAVDAGHASSDLIQYIETHTYEKPVQDNSYSSYGLYFDNNMLVPHGNPTRVDLRLGFYTAKDRVPISFTQVNDELVLDNDEAKLIEVIIQRRIGDRVSAHIIWVESDYYIPKFIYLTTSAVGEVYESAVDDVADFQLLLTTLYNASTQLPIYADKDTVYIKRSVPFNILATESGTISQSSIKLRTNTSIVESGVELAHVSSSVLMFDDQIINIDALDDQTLYAEYLITEL